MKVDFDQIQNFKMNFDKCKDYHQVGEIVRKIENSEDHPFLAALKCAREFYGEFRVAAVYSNGSMEICDRDDLDVLIENFPKEWNK